METTVSLGNYPFKPLSIEINANHAWIDVRPVSGDS